MASDIVPCLIAGCAAKAGVRRLCGKHYQAAWKAGALDQYPLPEPPNEDERFACPPEHKHAESSTCYTTHKCRCEPCRAARSARNRRRDRERNFGVVNTGLVDAAPVRAHVLMLSEHGIGYKRAATLAGVGRSVVQNLLFGRGRDARRLPARIKGESAQKLLAVQPSVDVLGGGALMSSRGVQRRLQALVARGWSMRRLGDAIGVSCSNFGGLLERDHVTARTHRTICEVYEKLWAQNPPAHTAAERGAVVRAKHYAEERGWVPPLAWDDIDFDDAPASAELDPEEEFDEVAVALAVEGRRHHLNRAELTAAIQLLHARKLSDAMIATRLGISDRTVLRTRTELGLPGWKLADLAEAA